MKQLVLGGNESMVLEVIDQVFLAMLAQEVKLDLARDRSPLEMVESLGRFDLNPRGASFKDSFNYFMVVAIEHDVFIELSLFLFVKGKQIILCFDLAFGLQLSHELLLFGTWLPNWWLLYLVSFVGSSHPV